MNRLNNTKRINTHFSNSKPSRLLFTTTLLVFPATPFLISELEALVAIAVELALGDCPLDRTSSTVGDMALSGLPVGLLRPLRRDDIYM